MIRINRLPYTVLGVAPAGFYGTEIFYRPDIWVPMSMQAQIEVGNAWLENRNTSNTWIIGRLKQGVSIEQAESNLNVISQQIAAEHGTRVDGPGIILTRPGLVGDAVGHFRYGPQGPPIEIVGVVETGKYQSLTEASAPAVFEPMLQSYNTTTVMLVRSSRPSADVASDIRRVMHALDPSLPLFGVRSVEEMLGFVLLPMRIAAIALGAFGVLAVMLAAIGIHGVVSYAVARRRREIAIRVAVGATSRSILQLVLWRIAMLVVLGSLAGLPLALATRGLLGSIVYQRSVNDASTMLGVFAIVTLVGVTACWLPARRALKLQPTTALNLE